MGTEEALSALERRPANLQPDLKPSGSDSEPIPKPSSAPRKAGDRITVPWRVTRIRLLGALEIFVMDEVQNPNDAPGEREASTDSIKGLGPRAKAALVALVLHLKTGRSPTQLGEAMEGTPDVPLALHTHVSAIRRTGLEVSHKARIYRVENLNRSQVDALQFEDLYREIKSSGSGNDHGIARAEEALQLWGGDPMAAHPYFEDKSELRQFAEKYAEIQLWLAKALIGRGERTDIPAAARLVEQLRDKRPLDADIRQLLNAINSYSSTVGIGEGSAGANNADLPPRSGSCIASCLARGLQGLSEKPCIIPGSPRFRCRNPQLIRSSGCLYAALRQAQVNRAAAAARAQ